MLRARYGWVKGSAGWGVTLRLRRKACEIRLRAERRCGQLLKNLEMAKGGRPTENRSQRATGLEPLSDLGISKTQSSRWQKLAAIPEEAPGGIGGLLQRG